MDTNTFLYKVLPAQGVYVGAQLSSFGMRHAFFQTIEDLSDWALDASARGGNVYYTVSAMNDGSERTQANTRVTKLIALDVDCGPKKPYPGKREGLQALLAFVSEMSLPKPTVIDSGNGLHIYWTLTDELEPAEWQPLANAMKGAAIAKDFYIDRSVPGDSARLLRIVGTINPKGGNTVKALISAPDVHPDTLRAALTGYTLSTPSSLPPTSRQQTPTSKLSQALAVEVEFPPSDPAVLVEKCAQIKWATENQGDVEEPFWYALLGVAAHCEDPEATAVAWSQNHPDYSYATTIKKMDQWRSVTTGPATCEKFRNERPSGCKNCKFASKITTPTQLGTKYVEVEVAADVKDPVANEVPLPRPFKRTAAGIVQTTEGTDIVISPYDIYPVGYGRDDNLGYEVVRYHWKRPHRGWCELVLRQAHLTDTKSREFTTDIADQGIVLKTKTQTESFQFMLRSYMDNLRQMRAMTNIYNSMGFKEDYRHFILGTTVFTKADDGSITQEQVSLASSTGRLSGELFYSQGNLSDWTKFVRVFAQANMPAHVFMLGVGFASPMLNLTGLNGVTIALSGPSGAGKTLAQLVKQSIWGHPDKVHFSAKFTQNALYNRLGLYCHLPMSIDEATVISDKEIGDFLYMVTQGRDKTRLTRSAEERETKTWSSMTSVSTNVPLSTKLSAVSSATNAQSLRLLELDLPRHPLFTQSTDLGRKIYQFVNSNFGLAGPEFAKYLLELGPDEIKRRIKEATETFPHRYHGATFNGEERFWETTLVLVDLALTMASEIGLIDFDHQPSLMWVLDQLGVNRQALVDNTMDNFDILSAYLNDNTKYALTMMHTGANPPVPILNRMPREEVRIRYDMYRSGPTLPFSTGTVTIDRVHFRKWLALNAGDYRGMMSQFKAEDMVMPIRGDKAYLSRDTDIKMGQSYVVRLNLSHDRLKGILDDAENAFETDAFKRLTVVK